MRIGTFLCLLFGHKFIGPGKPEMFNDIQHWIPNVKTTHCVRCGIKALEES